VKMAFVYKRKVLLCQVLFLCWPLWVMACSPTTGVFVWQPVGQTIRVGDTPWRLGQIWLWDKPITREFIEKNLKSMQKIEPIWPHPDRHGVCHGVIQPMMDEFIRRGLAVAYPYPIKATVFEHFIMLEKSARAKKLGIWQEWPLSLDNLPTDSNFTLIQANFIKSTKRGSMVYLDTGYTFPPVFHVRLKGIEPPTLPARLLVRGWVIPKPFPYIWISEQEGYLESWP
jgi:hypothetical protein